MPQKVSLRILPQDKSDEVIKRAAARSIGCSVQDIDCVQILKESIDARKRPVFLQLSVQVFIKGETFIDEFAFEPQLQKVDNAPPIHIAGCGPAGLFAALKCIELGFRPIILERGKDVKSRRRDLALMNKEGRVNPESNYCYGEGGAGTYSDGKLYTRSGKRGSIKKCLQWLVYFGANPEILYKAHPHIGTNKLPQIIAQIRKTILDCGGAIRFETKLTNLTLKNNLIDTIEFNNTTTEKCTQLILATGHSARDIFHLLHRHDIYIESKPFALGVRIEHQQALINKVQYKCSSDDPLIQLLGAAPYSLVAQVGKKGVFSFCMCPGGIIAPASTEMGNLVVNGWSPSKRNGVYANSGTVVAVDDSDFHQYGFTGKLAALDYQNMVEQSAWNAGGGKLVAPAQRLVDFVNKKTSSTLPDCSYIPGVNSVNLHEVLPETVAKSLAEGVQLFGKKMKGYFTNDAIITATESRTSSPIKIPRDKERLQHLSVKNLYPCAEGAGYAGGIISAAIDGLKVAAACINNMN